MKCKVKITRKCSTGISHNRVNEREKSTIEGGFKVGRDGGEIKNLCTRWRGTFSRSISHGQHIRNTIVWVRRQLGSTVPLVSISAT